MESFTYKIKASFPQYCALENEMRQSYLSLSLKLFDRKQEIGSGN